MAIPIGGTPPAPPGTVIFVTLILNGTLSITSDSLLLHSSTMANPFIIFFILASNSGVYITSDLPFKSITTDSL